MQRIIRLVEQDPLRVRALECVAQLNLPQGYIAAGFVRNLLWDHLHHKISPTPLNDIDVIYFDRSDICQQTELNYQARLSQMLPALNWQVRNQARMHIANGDAPYLSTIDAMGYWPEQETALAIRKLDRDQYQCVSAFSLDGLFNLHITHNRKRARAIFDHRVKTKQWLTHWPNLTLAPS